MSEWLTFGNYTGKMILSHTVCKEGKFVAVVEQK